MFRDLDVFEEFERGNLGEGEGWVKFERVFTPREAWVALWGSVGNWEEMMWTVQERVAWAPGGSTVRKLF